MRIKDLKKQIEGLEDDLEVFIRAATNQCGNIIEAGEAVESTYGFFGKSIGCLIIEPENEK